MAVTQGSVGGKVRESRAVIPPPAWWFVRHQWCDLLRLVGLRDRLRCPDCRAVGTWKPHAGWLDRKDLRRVRRWLCKWCGKYEDAKGLRSVAFVGQASWELPDDGGTPQSEDALTPQSAVANVYGRAVFPWLG